jgi:hypothetical protein
LTYKENMVGNCSFVCYDNTPNFIQVESVDFNSAPYFGRELTPMEKRAVGQWIKNNAGNLFSRLAIAAGTLFAPGWNSG